jgi:hypothetical protein
MVEAMDSIIVDYGKPLRKMRIDTISITCDSIENGNIYYLTQILNSEKSKEQEVGDTTIVEGRHSPWIGRHVSYSVDSAGYRSYYMVGDSLKAVMNPGGPFQPNLFFPLGYGCKYKGETWIIESTENLAENGYPVPALKQTSLFKMDSLKDTLDERCTRLEYIRTGVGNMNLITAKDTMQATSVINSFGVIDIGTVRNVPIHYFCTIEEKIQLHFPNGVIKPTNQFTNIIYTLIGYYRKTD